MVKRHHAAAAVAALVLGPLVLGPLSAGAQTVYPPPDGQAAQQTAFAPAALDQLVAPVALYPDELLAQIFAAATYPLQTVQAHRWISAPQNAGLTGGALEAAVNSQAWDPSVQALVPFPQVLQLMDDHLDWTEELGQAFVAQPRAVMDAVQRLRHRAQQAGTLKINPEQSVVNEGDDITIAPANDQDVYVPSYDAQCVYGAWPYPAPGPVDFGPWSGTCGTGDGLTYADADYLPFGFFLWANFDWRRHGIHIDSERYALAQPGRGLDGDTWRRGPMHQHGGYGEPANWHGTWPHSEPYLRDDGGPFVAGHHAGRAAEGQGLCCGRAEAAPAVMHAASRGMAVGHFAAPASGMASSRR